MNDGLVKILDGNTFVVSDENGDIEASLTDPTGLFSYDTRFLSKWVLTIDGERLNALSVDDLQYFETRFFLVPGTGTVYVDAKLSVIRERSVGERLPGALTVLNHNEKPVDLTIRLEAGSDFADLFEVKDALAKKGTYTAQVRSGTLELGYERETFRRATAISASTTAKVDAQGLTFRAKIAPHGKWSTVLDVVTTVHGPTAPSKRTRTQHAPRPRALACGRTDARVRLRRPERDVPAQPRRPRRAPVLAARRRRPQPPGRRAAVVHDDVRPRQHLHEPPGAPVRAELAATTLRALGEWQGAHVDDFRDEDPGRILHEMRYGEMTAFEERPHSPYYGCADATPLYVVLLDEYERWTGDRKLVRDLEHEARAALALDRRLRRPPGQRLRLVPAAQREDRASRTSAGRTRGTRSPTATAVCPASRARPASCRATRTTRRCAAPVWHARSGRTCRSPRSSSARRPTSSAASTATSGSGRASTSRSRSTPRASRSTR